GVCARREPGRRPAGSRPARRRTRRPYRVRDPGTPAGGRCARLGTVDSARDVTLSAPPFPTVPRATPSDRDALGLAINRASGARPIGGNLLVHHPDSRRALAAMLELIAGAERWVHFENYIIRDDRTGRRFAEAL